MSNFKFLILPKGEEDKNNQPKQAPGGCICYKPDGGGGCACRFKKNEDQLEEIINNLTEEKPKSPRP